METGKHPHAVLAMHAFSLEECGEYGRAEQAARAARALSPLDARAQYVEQIGVASGAVVQTRFGNAMRMLGHQPVMHMSWWEACLVPLGRAPPAGRGRMGGGGACGVAPGFSYFMH